MANNELRLLWRVIGEENIRPLLEAGVDKSWFQDPTSAELWKMV